VSDLSPEHLKRLEEIFEIRNAKYIFIPSSSIQLMRDAKSFPGCAGRERGKMAISMSYIKIRVKAGVICTMYHLSCFGWQEATLRMQLAQVRKMVEGLRGKIAGRSHI
jgi:hypothetical protein